MIELSREGYIFRSKKGLIYELFEPLTFGAKEQYTSDMILIMLSYANLREGLIEAIPDNHIVGYVFGATFLHESIEEYNQYIAEIVEEFETKHNLKGAK